ncbi:MAG: YabP/YqfC family sporulation protein [Clostridia bacterium]|nr:YabP/YqfC family sporulation protein [Clostridia bacterium]
MKLLEQILGELGADDAKAFTVIPSFGGYFKSVRSVKEYSPEKITLVLKKTALTLEGEKMEIGKYFEQDIFIKGEIKVIKID